MSSKSTLLYVNFEFLKREFPYFLFQSLCKASSILVGGTIENFTVYKSSIFPGREIFLA